MGSYHLAQVNVALAKAEMSSDVMLGFVSRLDEINSLADQAEGFVWRLQDAEGDATAIRVFEDPLLLVNLSVWHSIEALRQFVYKSLHVELIRDREGWFNKIVEAHQALWWVPAGHIPDVGEARRKLDYLRKHGPSAEAFTFSKPFTAPLQA